MAYALQSRTPLLTARNRYWTGQDYCEDLERVLLFHTHDDAHRWLSVHKHLRGILAVVSVEQPEVSASRKERTHAHQT